MADTDDVWSNNQQSGEMLDHSPLRFGKYKGMAPSTIAETDENYIRWMYEIITNFPTCSEALYRSCGGKLVKATASFQEKKIAASKAFSKDTDGDDDIPF